MHDFEVRTFPEHRQEILELLIGLWEEWQPDAVLQPQPPRHPPGPPGRRRRGPARVQADDVLGYEIPWNTFDFDYQAYVALERPHVERKVAALARYASQQHRNYANPEYIWNLARTHGHQRGPRVRRGLRGLPGRRVGGGARCGGVSSPAPRTKRGNSMTRKALLVTLALATCVAGLVATRGPGHHRG